MTALWIGAVSLAVSFAAGLPADYARRRATQLRGPHAQIANVLIIVDTIAGLATTICPAPRPASRPRTPSQTSRGRTAQQRRGRAARYRPSTARQRSVALRQDSSFRSLPVAEA
jgi:hypothetical protein